MIKYFTFPGTSDALIMVEQVNIGSRAHPRYIVRTEVHQSGELVGKHELADTFEAITAQLRQKGWVGL